jgi:predicted YcjX-like family ATPase
VALNPANLINNDLRIAVTGLANSGKSAFLTSLIWQIAEFDDADFFFGNRVSLGAFRELRPNGRIGMVFPFDRYRDAMVRSSRWPDKTRDCYRYACEYARSDWQGLPWDRLYRFRLSSRQHVEFFDFPGERVADAAIAAFEDYAHWSDHILDHMSSHSEYRNATQPYFDRMSKTEIQESEILPAYKEALARLIIGYKPLITPSVFLLDPAGQPAVHSDVKELAASRIVGLTEDAQFAPLSSHARQNRPGLAGVMANRYREYRRNLVLPLFENIGRSNRLVVLVDIPSLLMGGVGRYNDNRQVLLDLFETLRPDSSIGGRLRRLLTFWRSRIKRVAFVATKADLVHPSDVASGRLEALLRQMTGRAKALLDDVEFGWFICSACRSTRPGSSPHSLIGRLAAEGQGVNEAEFKVSPLPESWPDDWSNGEYSFSRVQPVVPKNLQIPPAHIGLDHVYRFLAK